MTQSFLFTPDKVGQDSSAMPGYAGEPFTGVNGHFVGQDDFVCPNSFEEFYLSNKHYVRNWVTKKLRKSSTDPDVEDWTQTLFAHLCQLPKPRASVGPDGVVTLVGGTLYMLGFTDVLHAFNPWAQYGASARRYHNFLNLCISNKYSSLRTRYGRDAVTHPGFSLDGAATNEETTGREYLLMDRSTLYREAVVQQSINADEIFVKQFREYVSHKDPALSALVDAIMHKDKIEEILEALGIDQNKFLRDRKRLAKLAKSFQLGRK